MSKPLNKGEILEKIGKETGVDPPVKMRRPTAQDYIGMGVFFKKAALWTYEEFIEFKKKEWQEQLRDTEKVGINGQKAPIDFKQYMLESREAVTEQLTTSIPKQVADGRLPVDDAAAATELANILLLYISRFLST